MHKFADGYPIPAAHIFGAISSRGLLDKLDDGIVTKLSQFIRHIAAYPVDWYTFLSSASR